MVVASEVTWEEEAELETDLGVKGGDQGVTLVWMGESRN